ncbi:hypothetical protein Patl1_36738 [Pistacia atlantica]|nr:hypothetical protein Patl1_36738 [Pistacia atlantica]
MHLRCSEYHELSVASMKVLVLVEVVEVTGVSFEIGLRAVMGEGGSGILFICFEFESADGSDVGNCYNYDGGARGNRDNIIYGCSCGDVILMVVGYGYGELLVSLERIHGDWAHWALSDGSLNSEQGNQAKTHGNSRSKTEAKVLIVLLAVVAVGLFSFFLFKLWQRKKREEQYARLLKLFEEDDELEVELGLRD